MSRSAVDPDMRAAAPTTRQEARRAALRDLAPSMILFAALAAGLLLSGGVIARSHSHDLMFVSDVIWRTVLGQVPHLDYETPVGIAFVWPYRLVAAFSGGTIEDVLRANVVVGGFCLALCCAVLPRRLSPPLMFLATAAILTTAMTGRNVDHGITNYNFLAPYNRWGWAFAMLTALIVALPTISPSAAALPSRRRDRLDGIVLGLVLAILYYLKISVFVATAGMTFAALAFRFLTLRTVAVALACGAAVAAGVEIVWGTNAAYLHDLARATEINLTEGRGLFRVGRLVFSAILVAVFGALGLGVLRLHGRRAGALGTLRLWWREALMLGAILAAAALIRLQNHPSFELVMFGTALIVAAEYGRRTVPALHERVRERSVVDPRLEIKRGLLGAALAVGAALVPAMDAASIAAHAFESHLAANCSAPPLRGSPLEHLLYPRKDLLFWLASSNRLAGDRFSSDRCSDVTRKPFGPEPLYENPAQDRRLGRTTALLRRLVRPGDVILALDFTNPYPAIFRTPPPRGALTWMDEGRSFSSVIHPDVAMLLAQTDFVVQADYGFDAGPNVAPSQEGLLARIVGRLMPPGPNLQGPGQDAWRIYGAAVEARFVPVAQSGEVRIWRRREARRR